MTTIFRRCSNQFEGLCSSVKTGVHIAHSRFALGFYFIVKQSVRLIGTVYPPPPLEREVKTTSRYTYLLAVVGLMITGLWMFPGDAAAQSPVVRVSFTETDTSITATISIDRRPLSPLGVNVSFGITGGDAVEGIDYIAWRDPNRPDGDDSKPQVRIRYTRTTWSPFSLTVKKLTHKSIQFGWVAVGGVPASPNTWTTTTAPSMQIDSPSVTEGDLGATDLTYTVTLDAAISFQSKVDYAEVTGGTATRGTDYTALPSGTLTFAAGETSKTIDVSVIGDATVEPDETVIVRLSNASYADLAVATGTGTITNDDYLPSRVPEFTDGVDFQRYYQGTPIPPLTFPRATDGDGPLTYALESPPPLPPGLTYTPPSEEDAHGGVLAGTPTEVHGKTLYTLTATDEDGDGAQASFFIVVMADTSVAMAEPMMPSFGDTVAAQRYVQNREIEAITLPQATGGDGALTYALTPDLPEGLSFTAETRVLSGLPTEAIDETTYTLTATDGDGDEATLGFALAVAEDLMPSFADTIVGAYRFLVKTDVEITFPEATGGDGTLAYIILPLLPDELQFDHEARSITGMLLQAILETEYTLSALDADGDVASLAFTLEGLTPDFDGNGTVNFADFAIFVGKYGSRLGQERYDARCDLNSDGEIGWNDFLIFIEHYDTEI